MAYLCLTLALLALGIKGYCGKKTSLYVRVTEDSLLFTLTRLILCALIGALVLVLGGGSFAADGRMLAICALSGISSAIQLASWMVAVGCCTMVTLDVSATLGSLLPAILGTVIFGDTFSLPKMLGFALIMIAMPILAGHSTKTKGKMGLLGAAALVVLGVSDGIFGFGQQLYVRYYTEGGSLATGVVYPKAVFNFYIYIFGAAALLVLWLILAARRHKTDKTAFSLVGLTKPLPYIAVMAACLFIATFLQTACTGDYGMPSQVLYPAIRGGCLVIGFLLGAIFFGERVTARSVLGASTALFGVVLLNVL